MFVKVAPSFEYETAPVSRLVPCGLALACSQSSSALTSLTMTSSSQGRILSAILSPLRMQCSGRRKVHLRGTESVFVRSRKHRTRSTLLLCGRSDRRLKCSDHQTCSLLMSTMASSWNCSCYPCKSTKVREVRCWIRGAGVPRASLCTPQYNTSEVNIP